MRVFQTATKRRYDNKIMLLGQILDYDNTYLYTNEYGKPAKLIPTQWIILNVFDDENDLKNNKRKYL